MTVKAAKAVLRGDLKEARTESEAAIYSLWKDAVRLAKRRNLGLDGMELVE